MQKHCRKIRPSFEQSRAPRRGNKRQKRATKTKPFQHKNLHFVNCSLRDSIVKNTTDLTNQILSQHMDSPDRFSAGCADDRLSSAIFTLTYFPDVYPRIPGLPDGAHKDNDSADRP